VDDGVLTEKMPLRKPGPAYPNLRSDLANLRHEFFSRAELDCHARDNREDYRL